MVIAWKMGKKTGMTQYVLYLIIVVLVINGCYSAPSTTNQTEDPQPVVLTATQLPNITPPPTKYFPPLLTPRVTPYPTVTHAEASNNLASLLQTNGYCKFPCFFGIHPDQTRYEELYGVIDKLGGSRFETLSENEHIRVSSNFTYERKGTIRVDLIADLQGDVVKDLEVTILNQLDTGITPEDWSAYNMDNILDIYGVPDTVELYFGTPYDALTFGVRLNYQNIYTSIMYAGITTESNKYLTPSGAIFCPEEIGIDSVVMHIGKHPFNVDPDGTPLSKVSGIDEQTFHDLFTENPSACLTLNRDAFYQ